MSRKAAIGRQRGSAYRRARARVLAGNPVCVWCRERPATQADHVPSLAEFADPSLWQGELVPSCAYCNNARGARTTNRRGGVRKQSRKW